MTEYPQTVFSEGGEALHKEPLSRQVAGYIRTAVLHGRLRRGQAITELSLAKQLNVSQAPVREAIQILLAEGIVTRHGARGKRIANPGPREIRESYFAGGVLEGAVVAEAIDSFTEGDIRHIAALVEAMRDKSMDGDSAAVASLDTEFHQYLFDKGGNTVVRELWYRSCQVIGKCFFFEKWRDAGLNMTVYSRHKAILDALEKKQPGPVEEVIRAHYISAGEILAGYASGA